ncbi:MAG TPA: zinc ribbon domain-containing protein [Armatimonadetes bacterium]|nr:zinc ribbon domain-containing protein [Armatimonadota bacterium]
MPTYDYYCKACDAHFEVMQRITEPPLTQCQQCGGPIQRLISPVGIIFKGSGFHVNDYRKPEPAKTSESKADSPAPTASTSS